MDKSSPWSLSGSMGLVTDYVDRGLSQSHSHAAVQGEIVWQHSRGAYTALWGSTVDFDDGEEATAELNGILGLEGELGTAQFNVSVAYIHYPGAASQLEYDQLEFGASVAHAAGPLDISAHGIFSPQNAGRAGQAFYIALVAGRQLTEAVSVSVHLGRQWHEHKQIIGPDYHDWGLALEWSRGRVNAALRYSDTDNERVCADLCDARLAAAIGISL